MAKLLLSFDFEDWHQLVHRRLGRTDWDAPGPALERQTEAIFALLDELGARATFFVLGMTAERYPDLVREIAGRGPRARLPRLRARARARRRRRTSSAATSSAAPSSSSSSAAGGRSVTGRRPSRSPATPRGPTRRSPSSASATTRASTTRRGSRRRIRPVPPTPYRLELPSGREIWEFPITVWHVRGRSVPIGGGAYWRVLPAPLLRRALRQVADENAYPVLYFHPYELDPRPLRAALPGEPDPTAATARRLEERAAQPGQAARRGSDSCNRPRIPARQLRGGTWRSRRTLRS